MRNLNYEKPGLVCVDVAPEAGFAASALQLWQDAENGSGDVEISQGAIDEDWA